MAIPFTVVSGAVLITDSTGKTVDMVDSNGIRMKTEAKIVGADGALQADVVTKNFRKALVTDATVTVEQVFGFDDFADSWFLIDVAGNVGDTIRVQLPAGTQDITNPVDDNDPAVDVTITLTALEVGNEQDLATLIVQNLTNNPNFSIAWRAKKIKDNPIVHIQAKRIGEKGDRLAPGSFNITSTGITAISFQDSDNDIIKRRGKQNAGARDPRDPRLVTIGISGEVQAVPGAAGDIFIQNLTDDGNPSTDQGGTGDPDLLVNGSLATPIEFFIPADIEKDIFITELRFYGGGNGIKYGNFLSKNSDITNGVKVQITSDEQVLESLPLRTTEDFKNKWSFGSGANFQLDIQAGGDQFLAVLLFDNPFPIRKAGTFLSGDDEIRVFIQDNISAGIQEFEILAIGFKREV